MDYDFGIDIQNPEPLNDYYLREFPSASPQSSFENLDVDNTYVVGGVSFFSQVPRCDPKQCDCIVYEREGNVYYFDNRMGYNCVGYALCRFAGIKVEHHIKLTELKKSVITTLNEFSSCIVEDCKDEIVPDNLLEVPFDRTNLSFKNGTLLFFEKEGSCTHVAKCFPKMQIQVDGQSKELENYCVSKIGAAFSMLHYYAGIEGREYGKIYDKMLILKEEIKEDSKDSLPEDTTTEKDNIGWIIGGTVGGTTLIGLAIAIYCYRHAIGNWCNEHLHRA